VAPGLPRHTPSLSGATSTCVASSWHGSQGANDDARTGDGCRINGFETRLTDPESDVAASASDIVFREYFAFLQAVYIASHSCPSCPERRLAIARP
jgi:hypothetical protein